MRSPTDREEARIARRHDAFGYERDLQPETLERRCAAFFPAPPRGWRASHVLVSSGQAAMLCTLTALAKRLAPAGGPRGVAHLGAYFETRGLIGLLPGLVRPVSPARADVILAEPTACDGAFRRIDLCAELACAADAPLKAVIVDTTLSGRNDGLDRCLASLSVAPPLVVRVVSGLKLLQGGLELANVGIVSVLAQDESADALAEQVRSARTLMGAGLHLVDALALEAPWFLDAAATDAYTGPIFAHNARLALAVATHNRRFEPVTHPAHWGGVAPYCAFRLRDGDEAACAALEEEIRKEAEARRLLIARGGSFGFRGHRFEIVKPETGEPPFLRVAMGRRGGWSCEGIIAMMGEIAAR